MAWTVDTSRDIVSAQGRNPIVVTGNILLAEDVTGKGHISRAVGNEDRISLIIPLAE